MQRSPERRPIRSTCAGSRSTYATGARLAYPFGARRSSDYLVIRMRPTCAPKLGREHVIGPLASVRLGRLTEDNGPSDRNARPRPDLR